MADDHELPDDEAHHQEQQKHADPFDHLHPALIAVVCLEAGNSSPGPTP
jgi:hypothetical protein